MAMNSFIPSNGSDDDDQNSSGGNGGAFPGGGIPGMPGQGPGANGPSVPSMSVDEDEVKAMLIDYNLKYATAAATMYRDALIQQTLSVLIGKTKPNALLVGSAGVGKTKIVEDIARRIATKDPLIPMQLDEHRVYELPLSNLMSDTSYRGQLESKIKGVIEFASDPKNKVILFIDEIHQITGGSVGTREGVMVAQMLKPALARGDLRLIGATTLQESRGIDDDPAFARRFSRLVVDELTSEQTYEVLLDQRARFTDHYKRKITVSDEVLREIVAIADQHSRAGAHRPDSAITLMDRAMSDRVLEHQNQIAQAHASGNQVVLQALQSTPSVQLNATRVLSVAKRLLTGNASAHELNPEALRDALFGSLKGQDDVLEKVLIRIERESLGIYPRTTPIAMMFAGASGVGKTQTAKILAEHVTDQAPIILNMTEYNSSASVQRIIGAPPGYAGYDSNAELPFDSLESNPHRVILLDEFEKADPSVQRLFLSALDEGSLQTSRGKTLDFSKAIIIATTNAARDDLSKQHVGFTSGAPQRLSNTSLAKTLAKFFDAELLGRFSTLVGFNPISKEDYREIVVSAYDVQRETVAGAMPHQAAALPDALDKDCLDQLVDSSYVPELGARPAGRAVRQWIEDRILTRRAAARASTTASATADGTDDDLAPVQAGTGAGIDH